MKGLFYLYEAFDFNSVGLPGGCSVAVHSMRDAFSEVTLAHGKVDVKGWMMMRLEIGT